MNCAWLCLCLLLKNSSCLGGMCLCSVVILCFKLIFNLFDLTLMLGIRKAKLQASLTLAPSYFTKGKHTALPYTLHTSHFHSLARFALFFFLCYVFFAFDRNHLTKHIRHVALFAMIMYTLLEFNSGPTTNDRSHGLISFSNGHYTVCVCEVVGLTIAHSVRPKILTNAEYNLCHSTCAPHCKQIIAERLHVLK